MCYPHTVNKSKIFTARIKIKKFCAFLILLLRFQLSVVFHLVGGTVYIIYKLSMYILHFQKNIVSFTNLVHVMVEKLNTKEERKERKKEIQRKKERKKERRKYNERKKESRLTNIFLIVNFHLDLFESFQWSTVRRAKANAIGRVSKPNPKKKKKFFLRPSSSIICFVLELLTSLYRVTSTQSLLYKLS